MATKKSASKEPARKSSAKKAAKKAGGKKATPSASMPVTGKDPRGGLTAAGRDFYNKQTGGHLKPGVKGEASTPEEKRRKGSFLTRHYTTPSGPVVKDGRPTRQALQASAWGEAVPKTVADEAKLAAKGRTLLKQYHDVEDAKKKK